LDVNTLLSELDEQELQLLDDALRDPQTMRQLFEVDYEWPPVDVETFVRDDYFMGKIGKSLWPAILDDLIEFFEGNYHEGVLAGSIGSGKGTFAEFAIWYMVYQVSCFRDPAKMYGFMPGTTISFVNLSVSATQAKNVIFKDLMNRIKFSPYFDEVFKYDKQIVSELRFDKDVWLAPGSSLDTSILGLNIFGACIDEVNFFPVVMKSQVREARFSKGILEQAKNLYKALSRRIESRFLARGGMLPGKLLLLSSSRYPDDFTEEKIKEAQEDKGIFWRRYSLYGNKPVGTYSSKTFRVQVGRGDVLPKILADGEEPAKGVKVVCPPIDFRNQFRKDVVGALQEIAGEPVAAIERFIRNVEKIFDCSSKKRKHPFSLETTTLKEGRLLKDVLAEKKEGRWVPRINPNVPRYAHIDLALTRDSAGFGMGHMAGDKQVQRVDFEEGRPVIEVVPLVYVDFMLEVTPPVGGEIIIGDFRSLIYQLVDLGFMFANVSLDGFHSADTIQILKSRGIPAGYLSVDADREPYEDLKNSLYEECVGMYYYQPVIDCLLSLEDYQNKIDHRPGGKKDVSDCVAAIVHQIVAGFHKPPPPPPPSTGYLEGEAKGEEQLELGDDDKWILER